MQTLQKISSCYYAVFPFTCCVLGFIIGSAYCWYEYGASTPYTVPGTLISVDRCESKCFDGMPMLSGCLHPVAVTLQWVVGAQNYTESGVYGDIFKCGSVCCRDSIGQAVLVELDPTVPDEALTFWRAGAVPYDRSAYMGGIFLSILAMLAAPVGCFMCWSTDYSDKKRQSAYQPL